MACVISVCTPVQHDASTPPPTYLPASNPPPVSSLRRLLAKERCRPRVVHADRVRVGYCYRTSVVADATSKCESKGLNFALRQEELDSTKIQFAHGQNQTGTFKCKDNALTTESSANLNHGV
ncbi:hypothetical protein EVAR_86623_1 [Eumeta japonica]|uniref:Uncharacterized protein n=1 Tax=Eumeta variegata TaxID=151549 RepID=A0A4C1W404_EUMVA|nr:hypothetical protein EVAR_86623_1 [Eumeta japonica]